MLTLSSKKALTIMVTVVLAPFVFISMYSFFYIKTNTKNHFNETLFRFTSNSAHHYIEVPVLKTNTLINSLSGLMNKHDIADYILPGKSELDLLMPFLVDSNKSLASVLISDDRDNYKVYPPMKLINYKPSKRPWYHREGLKDQVFYSQPYLSANNTSANNNSRRVICASMNLFGSHSEFIGNISFDLNFISMSNNMKGLITPYGGHFKVAAMDGTVIMSPDVKNIFFTTVPVAWIKEAKGFRGYFTDNIKKKVVFYQTYQNPDWIAFTDVDLTEYNNLLNNSYKFLTYIILGCIGCYILMALTFRVYFKKWINVLYANINDHESKEFPSNLEGLCLGLIKKNETLKQAVHTASIDALTNVGSRRVFDEKIRKLTESKSCFHLAMIDLDNFKKINDTFGHQMGDIVLQQVSQAGLDHLQGTHSLYRFGGEELVAIFEDITFSECYEIIDNWRDTISCKKWREQILSVTFSCGIARSEDYGTMEEIIAAADRSLYQAKRAGKNCVYPPLN
ncbi:sensor domain-containing diguanylate cyclase [Buttiauxella gaviniae]|uniref:diguanylate cyclase n=1 Tax=Buttiauxella gaviniae TaxID=82990 RepID=A0ABV3NNP4_9ENTR